jgi:hypothetical protein
VPDAAPTLALFCVGATIPATATATGSIREVALVIALKVGVLRLTDRRSSDTRGHFRIGIEGGFGHRGDAHRSECLPSGPTCSNICTDPQCKPSSSASRRRCQFCAPWCSPCTRCRAEDARRPRGPSGCTLPHSACDRPFLALRHDLSTSPGDRVARTISLKAYSTISSRFAKSKTAAQTAA